MRYLIILLCFAFTSSAQVDLTSTMYSLEERESGVLYTQLFPQTDEHGGRDVSLEIYVSEVDDSPESIQRVKVLKNIIEKDSKYSAKNKLPITIMSKKTAIDSQDMVQYINKNLALDYQHIEHQIIPSELKREPNAVPYEKIGRGTMTLIRGAGLAGGSFVAMYFIKDLSILQSISIALPPALGSALIMQYNDTVGNFLTSTAISKRWSRYVMESNSFGARSFRKAFGFTKDLYVKGFKKYLQKKQAWFIRTGEMSKYNELNSAIKSIGNGVSLPTILKKSSTLETFARWFVTEVIYVSILIKIPAITVGVEFYESLGNTIGHLLMDSSFAVGSQAFGDLAIHNYKNKKFIQLKADLLDGKFNDKLPRSEIEQLLKEINQLMDESKELTKNSHKMLRRISNIAKLQSTALSFFVVIGTIAKSANMALGSHMLISAAVTGFLSYAYVEDWPLAFRLKQYAKNIKAKADIWKLGFGERSCLALLTPGKAFGVIR